MPNSVKDLTESGKLVVAFEERQFYGCVQWLLLDGQSGWSNRRTFQNAPDFADDIAQQACSLVISLA